MLLKQTFLSLFVGIVMIGAIGCGGGTDPVADAPATPEPELTEEEVEGEEEYIRSTQDQ